jgi:hypothetical protein
VDDLAGLTAATEAPAETPPAESPVDIEARLAEVQRQFDERMKGFQRLIAEKDRAIETARQEAREAKLAGMSQAEIEEMEREEEESENDRLKAEIAILRLQQDYPDEVPLFRQILDAPSPEEQLKLIRQLRAAASSAQTPAPEPEPEIPPVDLNNPRATHSVSGSTFNGQPINEAWADRVLGSVQRM